MGFWSGLGKVLGFAAPIAAAPFTGGASLAAGGALGTLGKIGKVASAVAPTLTGLAAGKQKGREAANTAAQDKGLFQLRERQGHEQDVQARARLDMDRRKFGMDSQNNAYQNAMRSAVAKNIQDVGISGVPKGVPVINFSGGARPSAMGPEGRAAADVMNRKAMTSLMDGEKFDALPDLERTAAPVYQTPGALENILGTAATAANGIAGYQAGQQQQTMQQKILAAIEALNKRGGRSVLPESVGDMGPAPSSDSGLG